MLRRSLIPLAFVAVSGLFVLLLAAGAQEKADRGRKYKAPLPTARIAVTVLRNIDGKPINNAAVVFHPMEGERDKGNMELRTNEDGKTIIDVIPIDSTVRLQVIARGFQTYGEDYQVDKPSVAITIRMRRPGEQYSIYESHPANQDMGGKNGEPALNEPQTPKPVQGFVTAPSAQPNAQSGSQPQPK